jgi:hypothetical protein
MATPLKPVWHGYPTRSYTATCINFEFSAARRPAHPVKIYIQQGGGTIKGKQPVIADLIHVFV